MSEFRIDDGMIDDPRWVRAIRDAGGSAALLWFRLATWSSRQQTGGTIPAGLVDDVGKIGRRKGLRSALEALIRHGILERTEDGSIRIMGIQFERDADPKPKLRRALGNGLRYRIFLRDGFACRYCGARPDQSVLVVDHVHPVSAGGSNDPSNLVTACQDCNAGKGAMVLTSTSEAG